MKDFLTNKNEREKIYFKMHNNMVAIECMIHVYKIILIVYLFGN